MTPAAYPALRHARCFPALAVVLVLGFGAALAQSQSPAPSPAGPPPAPSAQAPSAGANSAAPTASRPPGTVARANEAQAQAALLKEQLTAIPALVGTGIDPAARGKDILAHLSAVLRLYRMAITPVQKVGEPSDLIYQEETASDAVDIANHAFIAARTEAALLGKIPAKGTAAAPSSKDPSSPELSEAQRLANFRTAAAQRAADLQAQDAANDQLMAKARPRDMPPLLQIQERLDGEIKLQKAITDALARVSAFSEATGTTGLSGDIDRLQRSVPELLSSKPRMIATAPLESVLALRDAGITTQASALFQLIAAQHSIDGRITAEDQLRQQALSLRQPLLNILRSTIRASQTATANAAPVSNTDQATVAAIRKQFDTLTATFNVLSEATVPLSQEVLLLEQDRVNLLSWHNTIHAEYLTVLRYVLTRVALIAFALGVIFLLSQIWQRLSFKYVRDVRRRRQLLVIRRLVVYFLSGVVLIFGFVTQFHSLATFAGFITAGIAVGLQTILLSVAAYFFIIGRYGVRVGDRITIASVTGDVIEVGLVRFYIAELAGTGTEFHTTGRVAVFSNSVLFQASTPLYKQMPGTEYAWHELTVKLDENADFRPAAEILTGVVRTVFDTYRDRIEQQHRQVETWMDTAIPSPEVETRLQLTDTGLQFAALFPVEIRRAAEIDQKITEALLTGMQNNEAARKAIAAAPVIKATIKG